MKKNLLLIALLIQTATSFANAAEADKVTQKKANSTSVFTTGIGLNYGPTFIGGNKNVVNPFPLLSYKTEKFTLSASESSIKLFQKKHIIINVITELNFGRHSRERRLDDSLDGMGNINASIAPGISITYLYPNFLVSFDVKYSMGGVNSLISDIKAMYFQPLWGKFIFTTGVTVRSAGKEYNQKYFGVTEEQSANTGLAVYKSANAIAYSSALVGLKYSISKNTSLTFAANYIMLSSENAKSSFIEKRGRKNNTSVLVGLGRTF